MADIYEAAEGIDEMIDGGSADERARAYRAIAREARNHGHGATVTTIGVVIIPDDPTEDTWTCTHAAELVSWLGY